MLWEVAKEFRLFRSQLIMAPFIHFCYKFGKSLLRPVTSGQLPIGVPPEKVDPSFPREDRWISNLSFFLKRINQYSEE
jgi:hypothetical protein